MMKKILSMVLVIGILFSFTCVAFASADAELYTFYGDGMLFKQNESAIISGTASVGSEISAELYNSGNELVAYGTTKVNADGTFEVTFDAPSGSFEEYKIVLKNNGTQFRILENVVFGELWLASGQSNMQYPLVQEKVGAQMYTNGEKLSKWLRVLLVPAIPEYKGSASLVPAEPQQNIPGASWVTGEDESVYNMSAVAYFFAAEMMNELNMPVGVLNVSLGGSVISSWISREAIDGDKNVKNMLVSLGEYYDASSWNEAERSIYYDMTCNYNLKTEALRHFRLSGMIWYQGESDIIYKKTPEQYTALFDLMQRSYTEVFEYKNGLLPIIYTQLAAYPYHEENGIDLVAVNAGFADMQKTEADSRAVVSIYDLPLTYTAELGAIHPDSKKDIGERMAYAAKGLVYGGDKSYTAATPESVRISDSKIYVTLDNVGDGLVSNGTLKGFAIAGADGVYVQAKAEIINNDTVVIYNEKITEPVSASYAYSLGNMRANLYASENGENTLPVSPFVTANITDACYWAEKQWADCNDDVVWHLNDDVFTKFYSSWESENANVEFSADSAFSGEKGLKVTADGSFILSPLMSVKDGLTTVKFNDECYDYSKYGKISFRVRNDGTQDVTFDSVKIYTNAVAWYSSVTESMVIPADGQWHTVDIDIDHLYLYGINFGVKLANNNLDKILDVEFLFSGSDSEISIDDFEFAPEKSERDKSFDYTKIFNVFNIVKMFFLELFAAII